jgi:hypothetical protein
VGGDMSIVSVGTTLTTGLVLSSDLNGDLVVKTSGGSITSATFEAGGTLNISGALVAASAEITTLNISGALVAASAEITTLTGTTSTFSSVLDTAGNLRAIPQTGSTKTAAYTLTISDIGEYVQVGSGGSVVVPNDVFSNGDVVLVVNNTTGDISIDCPITTAYAAGTDTDRSSLTLSTRGIANVLFIASSICIVSGNIS